MSSAHRPPWTHLVAVAVLLAVFVAQSLLASLRKSPVFDEPPHIASGLCYLATHVFLPNQQHPPLLKELSAVFLEIAGIHWPKTEIADAIVAGTHQDDHLEWAEGNNIIHDNGADRVLFWARLPFLLLAALGGWLLYRWGCGLVGPPAALAALFFYALDPTMVAHSALVTTDVGLTVLMVLYLFTLWRYLEQPGWRRLIFCGLALGAVLCAKFSAVLLLPITAVLLAAALVWPLRPVAASAAKAVGLNSPCPCGSGRKYKRCHGAGKSAAADLAASRTGGLLEGSGPSSALFAFLAMCVLAAVVIEALYFFPSNPFLYIAGLQKVNADHAANHMAYFHGELAPRFYSYFIASYLLKEPLAAALLALGGLWILLRDRAMAPLKKWFLLLTPAVFLSATTFMADDMGMRYIIPLLPFAYLLGGMALTAVFRKPRWGRYASATLCLWVALAAAGIYPDHLSYMNEAACLLASPSHLGMDDGTRCGPVWFDDSNVDWGQGLKQLRAWMDTHAPGRPLRLLYFGSYPPEGYLKNFASIDPPTVPPNPGPGLYAVSAHLVGRMPLMGASAASPSESWLRRLQPTAIVGHAFYIYDIR